eukprot:920101-Amphidinium_carterae.1
MQQTQAGTTYQYLFGLTEKGNAAMLTYFTSAWCSCQSSRQREQVGSSCEGCLVVCHHLLLGLPCELQLVNAASTAFAHAVSSEPAKNGSSIACSVAEVEMLRCGEGAICTPIRQRSKVMHFLVSPSSHSAG